MFLNLAPCRGLVKIRRLSWGQLSLEHLAAGEKDAYKAMRGAPHIMLQLYNSCGGHCLFLVQKLGEAGQMVLSDPGVGEWVLKLGRDNEHSGHLKQHVHRFRCTKGNGNMEPWEDSYHREVSLVKGRELY